LISIKDSGGKGQGLKRNIYYLTSILPDVRRHVDSFLYAFVRYPSNDNPYATLADIRRSLLPEERSDVQFVAVLDDMLEKIENFDDQIQIPLLEGRKAAAALLQRLLKGDVIRTPSSAFKFSPQESSNALMHAQMAKIHEALSVGLEL